MASALLSLVVLSTLLFAQDAEAASTSGSPGSVDPSFDVRFSGVQTYLVSNSKVYALALDAEDHIFVGGHFTVVNDMLWNGIARLKADGSLDRSFAPPIFNPYPSSNVVAHIDTHRIFVQSDGTVWVGFGSYSPINYLSNGSPVTYPMTNLIGSSILLVYPDGRTLMSGSPQSDGISPVQRLLPDATPDPSFQTYANQQGPHLLLRDGKILIGRSQYTLSDPDLRAVLTVSYDRRLPDGVLDESFRAPTLATDGLIGPSVERGNGQIYVTGGFSFGASGDKLGILRLNTNGTIDSSFNADARLVGLSKTMQAIALEPDGKILLAIGILGTNEFGPVVRESKLFLLNHDGSIDSSLTIGDGPSDGNDELLRGGPGPRITGVVVQRDGRILVGGDFQRFDRVPRDGLVRLFGDPIIPLQLGIGQRSGSSFELQLKGSTDVAIIEGASTLSAGDWQSIATITLGGASDPSFPVPFDSKQAFYRARPVY